MKEGGFPRPLSITKKVLAVVAGLERRLWSVLQGPEQGVQRLLPRPGPKEQEPEPLTQTHLRR
jgi:hypothetical protein